MLGFEGCSPRKELSYLQMIWMMALGWRLAGSFFELWLRMTSIELWLEMEGKHVAIPSCGLVILVIGVRVRVVARTDGLHLIRQLRVVANDIVNLVSRVRIVVRIGNSSWRYGWLSVTC